MRKISTCDALVRAFSLSILMAAFLASWAGPAASKSLFESIFGFLGPKPAPASPSGSTVRLRDGAFEDREPPRSNPFSGAEQRAWTPGRAGKYKTVCVRLCDGYYFPINHRSDRRQFYDDAQQCQARCGSSESRLFYMSPSASITGARDQTGLAYEKLKTAFLYRKKLLKNCTCRPEPWSVSERMRHKSYEISMAGGPNSAENAGADAIDAAKPQIVAEGKMEPDNGQQTAVITVPVAVPVPRAVSTAPDSHVPTPNEIVRRREPTRDRSVSSAAGDRQRAWAVSRSTTRAAPVARRQLRWPGDPS